MTSTRKPGPDRDTLDAAATHGGAGWVPRIKTHGQEVAEGALWSPYRVNSEVATLRAVLLAKPGEELGAIDDPDEMLMLAPVDVAAIERQCDELVQTYLDLGVDVHLYRSDKPSPPNLIFMRDLFLMTPEGAILGRPAAVQRAGEEAYAAEAIAAAGVPIVRTLRGVATFEGADALWLDDHTVLVGVGLRTNEEALEQLRDALEPMGVDVLSVPMPTGGVQHLLGMVTYADTDLAVLHSDKTSDELRELLTQRGVKLIELPPDDELLLGRSNNFVTLAPRKVLMPTGCPETRGKLEAEGVEVLEADVSEYIKAAGALGCLTGVLWRG